MVRGNVRGGQVDHRSALHSSANLVRPHRPSAYVLDRTRWIPEVGSLRAKNREDRVRARRPHLAHECVGVQRGQSERLQDLRREVAEVEGHDDARARVDRRGHDVGVVRVWQGADARERRWVVGDEDIEHCCVHPSSRHIEPVGVQLGAVLSQVAEHLVEDRVRPPREDQFFDGEPDQQVAQWARVEHTSIVDRDDSHGSVPEAQILGFLRKLGCGCAGARLMRLLER
jgi:hypothetical protein